MSDIFISYARPTAVHARRVAEALRARGLGVWLDEQLPVHRAYGDVIEERLAAARAVVVVWSEAATHSAWVRSEADAARALHKLVQLTIDGAKLPMPFEQIQCADLRGWLGEPTHPAWQSVLASVDDLLRRGEPEVPNAPAESPPDARRASSSSVSHISQDVRPGLAAAPVLAVLPFDNHSPDADLAYFSDGVSEEIQQRLASGSRLKVIGRASSFQFRGADKAAATVGAALRATHVLDGSVRRSGRVVRIVAQLVCCADETTLWSGRFDRELDDVFALQDDIAEAVAVALQSVFARPAAGTAIDPAIHDLFLRAHARYGTSSSREAARETMATLEHVVIAAPTFARAWAYLALARAMDVSMHGDSPCAGDDGVPTMLSVRAQVAAETALGLDPQLGIALVALAQLRPGADHGGREALLLRAIAASPADSNVLANMAGHCGVTGRWREAGEYMRRAYELDPLDWGVALRFAASLDASDARRRAIFEQLHARLPDNERIAGFGMGLAARSGDWHAYDALVADARQRGSFGPSLRRIAWLYTNLRQPDAQSLSRMMERMRRELAATGTVPLSALIGLHQLGRAEEAFELMEQASFAQFFDPKASASRNTADPADIFAPANTAMRADVRFVRLCAKLGLCDYWLQSGHWPDCADEGVVPYDFRAACRQAVDPCR
jgi:adenylate cyclase